MDVGLGQNEGSNPGAALGEVLILVLVDVGLGRPAMQQVWQLPSSRLNPCFSGCWSRTRQGTHPLGSLLPNVLILVLVDVGLGHTGTSKSGKN